MRRVAGRIGSAVSVVVLLISVLALPTEATTVQPLTGVRSLTSGAAGFCAVLTSGKVDCWGNGTLGQLGDGTFHDSALPAGVKGVGGTGTLGGVASLTAGGQNYCALLISGRVDCWGFGASGDLGNGKYYSFISQGGDHGSAVPVEVEGVGGTGTLDGVASLTGEDGTYCAVLTSRQVDCWGYDMFGEIGNGRFDLTGHYGSAVPVVVKGLGGSTQALGDVASLAADDGSTFCAVLASGNVDCWGRGENGQLGDGTFYGNRANLGYPVPVAVKSIGGTGALDGVASLTNTGFDAGFCALLTSGKVACWGFGAYGQLGDGSFYSSGNEGSAVPVVVNRVGGTGALDRVASLTDLCALHFTTGSVDCWGLGVDGQLGNGIYYDGSEGPSQGSATPVVVQGVGGTHKLLGVASVTSDGSGSCALLRAANVDCWGSGGSGQLGNGIFYDTSYPVGSNSPVVVKGVGGIGTLGGVASLTTDGGTFCALLTSKKVDCWGAGSSGELGNGRLYTASPHGSAVPVAVIE